MNLEFDLQGRTADLHARPFLPKLAVFFEGQVVFGLNLLEQDWLKFTWNQSWSTRAFERSEVVQVSVELQEPVYAATQARQVLVWGQEGWVDSELLGDFFW
jgi:hypothetical protein